MKITDKIICIGIRVYKRWISPNKGFACAHRVLNNGDSCSTAVIKIVEAEGVVSGFSKIVARFQACRQAAVTLAAMQRADLDCGLGGCLDVGGPAGCVGDLFGSGADAASSGTSGGNCLVVGDCFSIFTGRHAKKRCAMLIAFVTTALVAGYFTYGNRISAVEIRLLAGQAEDKDRKWGLVTDSELPDYQLLIGTTAGSTKSVTVHNKSANEWLKLRLPEAYVKDDISRIEITNRQLLGNKSLETFAPVMMAESGESFEYRLVRRWSIF